MNKSTAQKLPNALNKRFCLEMAIICAVAGIYIQVRHHGNAYIVYSLVVVFTLLYLLRPDWINGFRRAWAYLGELLGMINSTVVLCLTYFLVLTPMAMLFRLLGRNSLEPKFDKKNYPTGKNLIDNFQWKNNIKMGVIAEFFSFLRYRRKYWLWPLFFIILCLGFIVVLAHGSAIGPLLYSLF